MKNQALFFSEDKSKKLKCRLLQFLFGALRIMLLTTGIANNCYSCSSNMNGPNWLQVSVNSYLHVPTCQVWTPKHCIDCLCSW